MPRCWSCGQLARLSSDDSSSNTTDEYSIFCKMLLETNWNKQKEAGVGIIFY